MKEFYFAAGWHWFLIAAVVCYFIGCFNFAVVISALKKNDIRKVGSGNPGTMNMTRIFGVKIGVVNFFCDFLKGGLPALVGYILFKDYVFAGTEVLVSDFSRYFFGVFVIIGHIFPVTMKFKGGKGIASTMGLFAFSLSCEQLWYLPVLVAVHMSVLLYISATQWGSMGSLMGVSLLTVWQSVIFLVRYLNVLLTNWVAVIFSLMLALNVLTWGAHHKNIFRLLGGEEHRTSVIKRKNKI